MSTETGLTGSMKETILSAARKLAGFRRREFQAELALKYCDGKARQAELVFGWGRAAVNTGLNERRTGIRCLDNYSGRGRFKSEEKRPELVVQIHQIVEPNSQADPKFQTPLAYTRMTAKAVRQHLIAKANGDDAQVPAERTVLDIMNRLGYKMRRVRKTVPQKKFPKPTPSSRTCGTSMPKPQRIPKHFASRSIPKPR